MGNCCKNKVSPQNEEVPAQKEHHRMTLLVKIQSRKWRCLSAIRRKFRRRRSSSSEEGEEKTAAREEQNQSKAPEGAQDRPAVEENVNQEEEFEGRVLPLWKEHQSYFPDGLPVKESCDVKLKKWGDYGAQAVAWEISSITTTDDEVEDFPDGLPVKESCDVKLKKWGDYGAEAVAWEISSITTTDDEVEDFPDGLPVKESCDVKLKKWGDYGAQAVAWEISSITTTDDEVEEVKPVQEWELQSISSAENLAIADLYVAPGLKPDNVQNDVCYKEPSTSRPERSSPTGNPRKK